MKQTLISIFLLMAVSASAQKDTLVNDSTQLVTIKQLNQFMYQVKEKIKDKVTVKEYEDLTNSLNGIVLDAIAEYNRRRKKK